MTNRTPVPPASPPRQGFFETDVAFQNRIQAAAPAVPAAPVAAPEQDQSSSNNPAGPRVTDPTFTVSQDAMLAIKDRIAKEIPWIPNPLNDHQSYTYKFRFFMMQDEDYVTQVANASSGEIKPADIFRVIDNNPIRILAESGVTAGINIQDVKIESLVGPNMESTNTNVTNFVINLTEPMGTSLVETMRNAANDLDIRNMDKAPYFLELTFKGYTETGEIITNGDSSGSSGLLADEYENGGRWLYQIKITDIETELTASGSTYTVTALPFNDFGFDPSCGTSPAGLTITGATVGQMLDNLAEQLDKNWSVYFQYVTYEYAFDVRLVDGDTSNDPREYKIIPPVEDVEEVRNYQWTKGAATPTMTINLGTEVSTIVETIMASTQEARTKALAILIEAEATMTAEEAAASRSMRAARGVDLYRAARMFRIEPDVDITGFNYINNIYTKKITYCVWPFYTQAPVLSKRTAGEARDPAVQSALFNDLIERGFFRKKYDYLFTGNNTEVTRLDIRYNLAWAAVLPTLVEATSNTEQESTHARRADEETVTPPNGAPANGQTSADTPQPVPPPSVEQGQAATQNILEVQDRMKIIEREIAAAEALDPPGDTTALKEEYARLGVQQQTNVAEYQRNREAVAVARTSSEERDRAVTANRRRGADKQYLEDLEGPIERRDQASGYPPLPHDVSFVRAFNQGQNVIGSGLSTPRGIGRGVYGAILEQMYGPLTTGLINIDLEIRGDPYWLSHSNVERRIHMKRGAPPLTPASRMANYAQGDNVFMLEFSYPFNLNEDGSINIREDAETGDRIDKFTGLYRAVRVTNTFAGGEFRQTIKAQRFPLHDLARAMQFDGMHVAGRISTNEYEEAEARGQVRRAPAPPPRRGGGGGNGPAYDPSSMEGVDPRMQQVVRRAQEIDRAKGYGFTIYSGRRTTDEQRVLVQRGASRTMNSRHIPGRAVDLIGLTPSGRRLSQSQYNNPRDSSYSRINDSMTQASRELGIPITWGGTWTNIDPGHFQLR